MRWYNGEKFDAYHHWGCKGQCSQRPPFEVPILVNKATKNLSEGLRSLRWLNVKQRLMVNNAVMMRKCLSGLSPSYLSNKFCTRSSIHDRQTRQGQP